MKIYARCSYWLDVNEGLVLLLLGFEADHRLQVSFVGLVEVRIRDHQWQICAKR